ncbi:amidophosphoribosyltransferase [Arenimonas soli]|uniref:Amidophosphoribosyltransferase n=1 Tax=Arenimonas soli TaxID=2269504 RepID=A0ABQ1HMZ5_9GAMM|nr:ComF family protein [Arenimonas soli]GGA81946.1 amidophosphoribosyltransferase [Arenimonas soli]
MRRVLADFFAGLGPALLPWRCLVCTDPGEGALDLCAACRRDLPWNHCACARCGLPLPRPAPRCGRCLGHPPVQASTQAVFRYAPPLDRLLPRLKFHGDLAAGRLLAGLLAEGLAGAPRPAALVPIPLHRSRLRQRGYDQALELARPLARALALPLLANALQRGRATAPQSELDARARRGNVRGAFRLAPGIALPAHVALFDDVMTTGATLAEAARLLRRAGVARVDLWVAARA